MIFPTSRSAFTLLEVLVYVAIFTIAIIGITTIFVSFINIEARQGALVEVSQQSQFLLQQIQNYVNSASYIGSRVNSEDMPFGTPTSTLTLLMGSSTTDVVKIYASGNPGIVYLQIGAASPVPLSSSRVNVSNMTFIRRSNAPGHDSVSVNFTLSYNSTNEKQFFTQAIQTAVTRVNAATFDSNVVPNAAGTLTLGDSINSWSSVNNRIYFNGANVGINVSNPQQMLEVGGTGLFDGGLQLATSSAEPSCGNGQRGMIWIRQLSGVASDTVKVCLKKGGAVPTYIWAQLY